MESAGCRGTPLNNIQNRLITQLQILWLQESLLRQRP